MPLAAIRRWTARRDGFISIDGLLEPAEPRIATDAVRGWIVSSGTGMLGSAHAAQKSAAADPSFPRVLVKRGDTIDFVVVGKGPFNWAPTVKFLEGGESRRSRPNGMPKRISAARRPETHRSLGEIRAGPAGNQRDDVRQFELAAERGVYAAELGRRIHVKDLPNAYPIEAARQRWTSRWGCRQHAKRAEARAPERGVYAA